jgi:hypothetical protein
MAAAATMAAARVADEYDIRVAAGASPNTSTNREYRGGQPTEAKVSIISRTSGPSG